MISLDFGITNDSDSASCHGAGRTTVVLVPEEGDLHGAPADALAPLGDVAALVPTRAVLAGVPAVQLSAQGIGPFRRYDCHLLWIAERAEWVALFEERILDLDSWLGEGRFRGPYRVDGE